MQGYIHDIEKATLENADYRRVLYTTKNSQLVVMCIQAGDEIGVETHTHDQFLRLEQGEAKVIIDDVETKVDNGFAIVIPAGAKHNIINTGPEALKLYSIYSPPEHKHGTITRIKSEEIEEHFDGVTSE
ncbi:MAG: cupin domain-containing protein [Patescibacteria group bacterium]